MTVSSTATTQSSGGTQDNGSSPVVRRQLDPSVLLIMVAAAAVYSLHGFQEALETETSIFAYGGQQVLEGTPPYVSVFNVIGPMGHLLAAFGALVARGLGLEDLLGMRLLFLVFAVLAVGCLYLLARTLFSSRLVALAATASFVTFASFLHYAVAGPREKTVMVLFVVVALLCAVRRRWIVSGVAASLATLTWQPAIAIGLAVVITALITIGGGWRAAWKVVLGALIP